MLDLYGKVVGVTVAGFAEAEGLTLVIAGPVAYRFYRDFLSGR